MVHKGAKQQPPAKRRGWLSRLAGWLGWAIFGFALGSIALVLALRWPPLPTSSVITQSWINNLWAEKAVPLRYKWTPYTRISPHAALAVIAAEDQRFPAHRGFDLIEIQNALESRSSGRSLRGASTISQQAAKNLFLWSGRSWLRKGLEVWFTLLLEWFWPKERILEVYLNIAQFGENTFGVEAASRRFFNKPAARLTASEAARLAAALPNPARYRVNQPTAYLLQRQRWIQQQMEQLGGVAYLNQLSGNG